MAAIDDVTVAYHDGEREVVKELDKVVLTKGAWATVMFRYQDWMAAKECYSPDKFTIRRYKKSGDKYLMQSKFNISSKDQAEKIIAALQTWLED